MLKARQVWQVVLIISVCWSSFPVMPVAPVVAQITGVATPVPAPTASATPVTALPFASPVSTPVVTATPAPIAAVAPVITETVNLTTTRGVIDRGGGRMLSADRRVQLDVPPGLLRQATRFTLISRRGQTSEALDGVIAQFDIAAWEVDAAADLTAFEQPVTLTLNLRGLIDLSQLPADKHLYLRYQTEAGDWQDLPTVRIDPTQDQVSMRLTQPVALAAGVASNTPTVWRFAYDPPQAGLFNGSASYRLPLQMPAGRNGLQPNLALSYNSARLNGRNGDSAVERGPIGDSWTLEGGIAIIRDRWYECWYGPSNNRTYATCFEDVFTLMVDGTGYELSPMPGGSDPVNGQYYAKEGPGFLIERHNDCLYRNANTGLCTTFNPAGDTSPENQTGEYWIVRLPNGTVARLGYTDHAEQVTNNVCIPGGGAVRCQSAVYSWVPLGYKGRVPGRATHSWRVDTITDTLGNVMLFDYSTTTNTLSGEIRVTLRDIYYNSVGSGGPFSYRGQSFLTHIALGGADDAEPTISHIDTYAATSSSSSALVHTYVLTQTTDTQGRCQDNGDWVNSSYTSLTGFQEVGATGARLPAQTFTYDWRTVSDCPWNTDLKYLTRVDNGYGGSTAFTYDYVGGANNYRVTSLTTTSGVAGNSPLASTYTYGPACFDYYGSACQSRSTSWCGWTCDFDNDQVLSGFAVVTRTQWDGATPLVSDVHAFFHINPTWQVGKEYRTQTIANGGALLTERATTYTTKTINNTPFVYPGETLDTTYANGYTLTKRTAYVADNYGNTIAEYDYGAEERLLNAGFESALNGEWVTSTVTATLTTTQAFAGQSSLALIGSGNGYIAQSMTGLISGTTYVWRAWVKAEAGNTSQVKVYVTDSSSGSSHGGLITPGTTWTPLSVTYQAHGAQTVYLALYYQRGNDRTVYVDELALAKSGDLGDERSTYHNYTLSLSPWIVNKQTRESVYAGIGLDDNGLALAARTRYRYDYLCPFSLTQTLTKGLLTGVDRWNGGRTDSDHCGQVPFNANFETTWTAYDSVWGNPTVVTDTRNYTASTGYDSVYHLYPVTLTNAANQRTYLGYDLGKGALTIITDANGLTTTYTYDGFGRLLDTYRPGDAANDPSVRYNYSDLEWPLGLAPLRVSETRKPGSLKLSTRHFYDGLGREIQTHTGVSVTVSGDLAPRDIIVSQRYDARGLLISQTVPYTVPAYVYNGQISPYTTTNAATAPKTLTEYDALGRATKITQPDGTVMTNTYYIAYNPPDLDFAAGKVSTEAFDANGHVKRYSYDARGNLIMATEFITHNVLEYRTRYTYDALGSLTKVRDQLGNTTVITYDALGRKTAMVDPDMGQWTYQYDAAGNLIKQTDALSQSLLFAYDNLNRLTGKWYSNTLALTTTKVATYTYDTGSNQQGYRTRLDDPSGWATWAYDSRGRVVSETKSITGAGAFSTQYGYDLLDRVVTTTLPTQEVITQTYNNLGALENIRQSNGDWYVKNLDYTANGSVALLQLGNNISTTYNYFPLNFRLQRLQIGNVQAFNYGYDNVGNVLTLTTRITQSNPLTETVAFKYDALDRLTNAVSVTNGYTGTYGYNAIGNLITKTESTSPITYTYGVTQPHAARSLTNGANFQYDLNGNMTRRVEMSGTQPITYAQQWDAENRLTVVTNTDTLSVTRFVYDGDGARVKQLRPDGSEIVYVGGWLEVEFRLPVTPTNFSVSSVSSAQINLTWVDASNNESGFKIARAVGGVWAEIGTVNANFTTYSDGGLTCNTAYTYRIRAYNSAGHSNYSNAITGTTSTCATPPAAPGNLSGYASATEAALSWADNSGNEDGFKVERGTYWQGTVYWSEVALVGTNVTWYLDTGLESDTTYAYRVRAYNALGDSGYSNIINVYTNGGSMMAMGLAASPLALTGQSAVPAGQIWKSYYRAGSTLIAVRVQGDPTETNNGLFYLHSDHLGSVSLTTDANGNVVARQKFDAWGNLRSDSTITGTMPTDVGFTGQHGNLDIALLFYNARYYSPGIIRFISADTIVPDPTNPQTLNRYAYGLNNPVKYTDPSGHMPTDGCQTEGCATDEDWAVNLLKGVVQTTDFSDSNDDPIGQMTLGFFQWTLDHYTPEAGPMTLGDAARDAWHASHVLVQGTGRSAADTLQMQRAMGNLFDFAFIAGAMGATQRLKAIEYEFVESYRAHSLRARLPIYNGGKTRGVLDTGSSAIDLISGYNGPSANLPKGTRGFNGLVKSHVEAHAAAVMRQQGLQKAALYINRIPCAGRIGCQAMLPYMLPPGAELTVYGPNGWINVYTGIP